MRIRPADLIDLPKEVDHVNNLHVRTQHYWVLSSIFHGRANTDIVLTTEDGLNVLTWVLAGITPYRSLFHQARKLQKAIISYQDNPHEEEIVADSNMA